MKGKSKFSPFQELLRAIENEIFNLALELQRQTSDERNLDFILGYRCALNVILERAYAIYTRRFPAELLLIDERTEEASELLLSKFRKRD